MENPNARRIGVGFGVMMLKENKILLGKRHPDPDKASSCLHGEGTWTMPGGKLRFGESFEEGACREVLTETGIDIHVEKLKIISMQNDFVGDAHFVTIGLLYENFHGEPHVMEPEEITEWRLFPLDELPSPLFPASQKVLENYFSKTFYKR
jgi:8-oxo-dGTP diphosphatase